MKEKLVNNLFPTYIQKVVRTRKSVPYLLISSMAIYGCNLNFTIQPFLNLSASQLNHICPHPQCRYYATKEWEKSLKKELFVASEQRANHIYDVRRQQWWWITRRFNIEDTIAKCRGGVLFFFFLFFFFAKPKWRKRLKIVISWFTRELSSKKR